MTRRNLVSLLLAGALIVPGAALASHDGLPEAAEHVPAAITHRSQAAETAEIETAEATEPQHFELQGTVTANTATTLTTDGQTVQLTAATKVHGTIAVGRFVHVTGTSTNGVLTAMEVNVQPAKAHATPPAKFQVNNEERTETAAPAATKPVSSSAEVRARLEQELNQLTTLIARLNAFLASHFQI